MYNLIRYFFKNVDIQLILEFKNSFRKYHLLFNKKPKEFFLGHSVYLSCIDSIVLGQYSMYCDAVKRVIKIFKYKF